VSIAVTVLYFDGCASWQTALEHVHAAAKAAGISIAVTPRQVETIEDARTVRFTGSPTLLLNGTDPFLASDAVPALACRVYATPEGLAGSPTVDQLVAALHDVAA
jgi:hypothetical protein